MEEDPTTFFLLSFWLFSKSWFFDWKSEQKRRRKGHKNLSSAPFFPFFSFGSVFGKNIFCFRRKERGVFSQFIFCKWRSLWQHSKSTLKKKKEPRHWNEHTSRKNPPPQIISGGQAFPEAPHRPFECYLIVDTAYTRPLTGKFLNQLTLVNEWILLRLKFKWFNLTGICIIQRLKIVRKQYYFPWLSKTRLSTLIN